MQKTLSILALILGTSIVSAQAPYTTKQYGWRVEKDLEYGIAMNYAGIPTSLTLDLYKPIGDNNPNRPLMVLVHGGSWLSGCKEGEAWLAQELAQRGYAVASVNYRKGWHKAAFVANPGPSATDYPPNCLYAADSLELIRAIYRGQQDVKGAIRWLKARAIQDSTCNQKVMVGGESAGAFLALAVGLLDRPEEKPISCFALADAPKPAANVTNCYDQNCVTQIIQPTGAALQRPDLGPLDGNLNLNGYNSDVIGVASFFGGVPYEALPKNWLQGPDTPALYLYHQTCDGVVPFGYEQPMVNLSTYCNLGYTPWHTNFMHTFGNGSIASALLSMPNPPPFTTDFLACDPFNPALALFECARYGNNGSYHYPHNPLERAQKVADFFSPIILEANCFSVATHEPNMALQALVSPNPFEQRLSVYLTDATDGAASISLTDVSGKIVWSASRILNAGENILFEQNHLPAGFYALQIRSKTRVGVWKVVKE
ncbi:MAG: T9SS type A sorting domain-containing protein [Phycisphaerae bacterium]|nr:T9SS type A sorting domain-containing protein [Saprospiraceae bacterium]